MKEKKIPWKPMIDVLMLILLFNQMAYVLMEQRIHEWTGTILVLLALCHNILNRKWYAGVGKGSYKRKRIIGTAVNFLTLAVIAALFASGVVMSRHVFRFLPVHRGRALARKVHIACAYWGFLLMAAHFGMHWNGIRGKVKKRFPVLSGSKTRDRIFAALSAAVSVYGIYAAYRHEIFSFLFLKNEFAIFNPEQSVILFVFDYIAVFVLVVNLIRRV